mgnify:CR=1 FL=1
MTPLFRTIVADPPWPMTHRDGNSHYPLMSMEDIKGFQLPPIDTDCRLFLWRLTTNQRWAIDLLDAWGFRLRSEIVWIKMRKNGNPQFGMGSSVRSSHETCLIAERGKPPILSHSIRSVLMAQVGIHSQKPEEFYGLVEKLSPGPYLELFARKHRVGWTCLGNELA